jgi:CHASE3 domain sensor protein
MTEAQKTVAERTAELSEELLDSVESGRKAVTDAIRKFVGTMEEASPALADESRRKTVIDAAVDLADSLVTTQIQFLRSVARTAGEALSKKE